MGGWVCGLPGAVAGGRLKGGAVGVSLCYRNSEIPGVAFNEVVEGDLVDAVGVRVWGGRGSRRRGGAGEEKGESSESKLHLGDLGV